MLAGSQLFEQLNKFRRSKVLIVGVGNVLKGDDGAGPLICQRLAGKVCADLIDAGTVPENYIRPVINKAPQNLLVIDAVDFGGPVGAIRIFEPQQLDNLVISTHTLSPRLFVDMVRREIEVDVYFIGIQPGQIGLGQPLSGPVEDAIEELCRVLVEIFPEVCFD
jgi:hydrogenase 3 maturation protease